MSYDGRLWEDNNEPISEYGKYFKGWPRDAPPFEQVYTKEGIKVKWEQSGEEVPKYCVKKKDGKYYIGTCDQPDTESYPMVDEHGEPVTSIPEIVEGAPTYDGRLWKNDLEPISPYGKYYYDTPMESGTFKQVYTEDERLKYQVKDTNDAQYCVFIKSGKYYMGRCYTNTGDKYPLVDAEGLPITSIDEIGDNGNGENGEEPFNLAQWIQEHPQEAAVFGGLGALGLILISR